MSASSIARRAWVPRLNSTGVQLRYASTSTDLSPSNWTRWFSAIMSDWYNCGLGPKNCGGTTTGIRGLTVRTGFS